MATEINLSSYLSEEFDDASFSSTSSPASSPPPSSEDLGLYPHQADHKNKIRSFQMKFTYLKEPRKRTRTTPDQLDVLIKFFEKEQTPSNAQRKMLADKTGMPIRAVQVWFQNRRAKRRCPSSPPSSSSSAPSPSPSGSPSASKRGSASPSSFPLSFTTYCPADYAPFKTFLSAPKASTTTSSSSSSPCPLFDGESSSSSSSSPLSSPTDSPLFSSDPEEFLEIEHGTLVLEADAIPPVWESPFDRDQLGLDSLLGEELGGIF